LRKNDERKNNNKHKNYHHIFSTSRFPKLSGIEWNKIKVNIKRHVLYHYFFNNSSPMEVVEKLVQFFPIYIAIPVVYFLNNEFWGEIFFVNIKKNGIRLVLREKYRKDFKDNVENSNAILKR